MDGSCVTFDPTGGPVPGQRVSLSFPGTANGATKVNVAVSLADVGGGLYLCERQYVRFDDFRLVASL